MTVTAGSTLASCVLLAPLGAGALDALAVTLDWAAELERAR